MKIECKYKYQNIEKFNGEKYCLCFNDLCKNLSFACDKNCQIFEDYKQLQQLKAENEELKEFKELLIEQLNFNTNELELRLSAETQRSEFLLKEFKKADKVRDEFIDKYLKSLKILDEIEEIIKDGDICCNDCKRLALNIIKQAKEGK